MNMSRDTLRKATAISLVLTLAAASFLVARNLWKEVEKNTYSAYFTEANGLFVGDEIRILGVAVGVVDKIEPQPTSSKVTFSVDKQYPVPADARAAILSPSLVTSRAIQLVPAYSGGPKLSPGASIPLNRTAVPVEWDDFRKQLEKLTEALQPTTPGGVNSVGEFVNSAADNLRGQGTLRATPSSSCPKPFRRSAITPTTSSARCAICSFWSRPCTPAAICWPRSTGIWPA